MWTADQNEENGTSGASVVHSDSHDTEPAPSTRSEPASRAKEVVVDGTRYRIPDEALQTRIFTIQVLGGRYVLYSTHAVPVSHDASFRSPMVKVHTDLGTFDCEPVPKD